jgi:hypothetical protein
MNLRKVVDQIRTEKSSHIWSVDQPVLGQFSSRRANFSRGTFGERFRTSVCFEIAG